jgi:hypothetical protein
VQHQDTRAEEAICQTLSSNRRKLNLRIFVPNACSHRQCPPVADESRDVMPTASMMDDSNASALIPARKSSNGVLSSRLFSERSPFGENVEGLLCFISRLFLDVGGCRHPSFGIPNIHTFVTVPHIHSFAARTFGAKPRPLVISNTQKASARRSAKGGCLTSL